jgi:predicted P-loop ATPase
LSANLRRMTTNNSTWKIAIPVATSVEEGYKTPLIVQVAKFLNDKYEIRKNEVKFQVEIRFKTPIARWKEVTDEEIATLIVDMKAHGIPVNREMIDVLFESRYVPAFDPIKEYFKTLPAWDGHDYIGELALTVKTRDQQVWLTYFRKWLVAMVKSAMDRETTNQQMLVFFGRQGVGKTRWILKLLPGRLRDYIFTGYTNFDDQMFKMKLARYLLIFLDELDSYKGSKQAIIKGTITQELVRFRPLYNAHEIEVQRRASFIAAINHEKFLHDISGSRRFLVVECLDIDTRHQLDLDKVYSQALSLARDESFKHYFDSGETEVIELYNEQFKSKTDVELIIDQYIEPAAEDEVWARKLTATGVVTLIREEFGYPFTASPVKVGEAMHKMGFKRVSEGVGNSKRSKYLIKLRAA